MTLPHLHPHFGTATQYAHAMGDTQEILEDDDTEKARQGKRLAKAKDRIEELEAELSYIRREANQQKAKADPDPDTIWLMAHNAIEQGVSPPPRANLEAEVERLREANRYLKYAEGEIRSIDPSYLPEGGRAHWKDALAALKAGQVQSALDAAEDGDHE